MILGIILICFLQVRSVAVLSGIDEYNYDMSDLDPEVPGTWFSLGNLNKTNTGTGCNKKQAVKGFKIQVESKLYLNGSYVTFNWTLDAGCDVILSWMYSSLSVIQEWFNGVVQSGSKTIYFQSPRIENISVFAMNYVLNESYIYPSIESFNVSLELYSLDNFYVDYNKYVPSAVNNQDFKVGVRGTNQRSNKDITLLWNWGDGSHTESRFNVSTFTHYYTEIRDFQVNLTVTWKETSRVISLVFHRGELEYKVNQITGNIALTKFEFTVKGLGRLNPNLNHYVMYGDGKIDQNTLKDKDVSVFNHIYANQGIYQVTFKATDKSNLIEDASIGLHIIIDNPIKSLVIETNDPIRYPPAILTLIIRLPPDHLPVHNMECVLDMDDFIDWKTYNDSAHLVDSTSKLMFTYTYLTHGEHYIKISCRTISSLYETVNKVTVYNDCFSPVGIFDYKYSREETAMNVSLPFNAEIGSRKDILCSDTISTYTWSIEQKFNGSYVLLDKKDGEPRDFQIKADNFTEGLHRLNLTIRFRPEDWYHEFTYINFVSVPVRSNTCNVVLINCVFNCYERVATRHILHVQLICLPRNVFTTNLTWTLMIVNGTRNISLDQITHYDSCATCIITKATSIYNYGTRRVIFRSFDLTSSQKPFMFLPNLYWNGNADERINMAFAYKPDQAADLKCQRYKSGIHNKSLIIRGGSLTPGTNYTITVSIDTLEDYNSSIADYFFYTNLPPSGGSCEVNPSIGFAGETLYTINCSSWTDDDDYPLYYQYLLLSGDNKTVEQVLYVGSESTSAPLYLRVGDRYNLYRSHIEVRITDTFGDYTEVIVFVTTLPLYVLQDIKDVNTSFDAVWTYVKNTSKYIEVSNSSGDFSKILRQIQSASSNIALIPLPYQGISLDSEEINFIGFTKNMYRQEVSYDWDKYWADFLKPRDPRQQEVLTKMTSSLSGFSLQLCRQIVSTRFAGTYTISSLTSSMADLISGPDYVTRDVLLQVLECAGQLNTNLVMIAASPQRHLQNHENITLAAEGMVRLVSKMLKSVYPALTPYLPQNPTVQVMRNFLQYMHAFYTDEKYQNRTILLQEQTFIAMKELRRLELEKERKKIIALEILPGWRKLLQGAAYALDALSGLGHPEIVFGDGLSIMSSNHWIWLMRNEEIMVAGVYLNFSGSVPGIDTQSIMNVSTVVFQSNPFYWGLFGEKISSRVVEFVFHPKSALVKSKVNITIPNEGNLDCKYKAPNYTEGEDNATVKYLYHSFDRQSLEDDVLIFIKSESMNLLYDIYVKFGDKPTQFENNYATSVDKSNWTVDGFRVIIRARYLPLKGNIYLAFVPRLANKTFITKDEDPRMSPVCLFVSSVHCRNWNGADWVNQACQVSEESSLHYTTCICEMNGWNLTTGTTFYFPKNFQTFEPPYVKPFYSGTSRILVTLAAIISLYLLILTWAWWNDSTEDDPWQFTFLSDTDETHKYFYLLRIYTGFGPMKGTSANICFELAGEMRKTGVRTLSDDIRRPHDSGSVRNYIMGTKKPLGDLIYLHIWHDHSGDHNGSWFLRKIIVDDLITDERTIFCCNKWLSLQKGDGEIERKICASTDKETKSIGYRLSTNISHYFAYIYIWSSIFVRMHPLKMSRVGRVTGAFVMVMGLMATNLILPYMDFKAETKALILGPFHFSENTFYSALISICITVPVMYLLFAVIYKSNLEIKCFPLCRHLQETIVNYLRKVRQTNYYVQSEDNADQHIFQRNRVLPAFYGIMAWVLQLCIFCASLFYTIYAATQISLLDAETGLTRFLIALFASILVFETLLVVLAAILSSIFGRLYDPNRPVVNVEGLWLFCERSYSRKQKDAVKATIPPSLLPKTRKAVRRLRRKLMLKSQTRLLMAEMIAYFIFLVVVYIIALSSSDVRAHELKNQIDNRLDLKNLKNQTDFLEWMNKSFFDLYFPAKVFAVQEVSHELKYHFIDFANIRVGPARLRQVRVKEEPCAFGLFGKEMCHGEYQLSTEDTLDYYIGWKDGRNRIEQVKEYTFTVWHHVTTVDVWGLTTSGNYNRKLYGGGGYLVKLDINRDVSEKIITELKKNNWIDRGTRAVFLEFTFYNPNVNLFSFVKYVREYPEVGNFLNYSYISTFRLYYDNGSYIICYFIFVLFVMLLFLRVCYELYINGTYYFNELWNTTDFVMLLMGMVSVGLLFFRQKRTKEIIEKYHEDQNEYVNFEHLAFANSLLITLLAILLFYATLRMIRIQGRSKWFDRALRVIHKAKRDLLGFVIVSLIVYSAYICSGYLLFGRLLYGYRDPFATFSTLAEALLGKNSFTQIVTSYPFLGEFYYGTFVFLVICCLITMATAIMNASIALVTSKAQNYAEKGLDDIVYKLLGKCIAWVKLRNMTRVNKIGHTDLKKN